MSVREIRFEEEETQTELMEWCNRYTTVEQWLCPEDPEHALHFITEREFLLGLNILFSNTSLYAHVKDMALRQNRDPALIWCWMSSEHLELREIQSLVEETSRCFHIKAGYAKVFHHDIRMKYLHLCVQAVEHKIDNLVRGRAMARFTMKRRTKLETESNTLAEQKQPRQSYPVRLQGGEVLTEITLHPQDKLGVVMDALDRALNLHEATFHVVGIGGLLTDDVTVGSVTDERDRSLTLILSSEEGATSHMGLKGATHVMNEHFVRERN